MGVVGDKLKENVKEHLHVDKLISDIMDEVLEPALEKVVSDTSNPFDDILKDAVYPVLSDELKKLVAEKWAGL